MRTLSDSCAEPNKNDMEAVQMVTRMDALFCIDRDARQQGLSSEQRLAHRQQRAPDGP